MPDRARAHSKPRRPDPLEGSEVAELRTRLASQSESIEDLRRELSWLTEELIARESGQEDPSETTETTFGPRLVSPRMFHRTRRLVHEHVPHGSRLVVASSGDDALLRYAGYKAGHLSRDRSGAWAGSHPGCGRAAVVQLEAARWRGADALLIPDFQIWWFDHYPEFARHLERRYALVVRESEVGEIWDLRRPGPTREIHDLLARVAARLGRQPVLLDWHTGYEFASWLDEYKVISPIGEVSKLPYLDDSIDVVAVIEGEEIIPEARRVAAAAVIAVRPADPPGLDVLWESELASAHTQPISIVVASKAGEPSTAGYVRTLSDTLPASFTGEILVDVDCDPRVQQLGPEASRLRRIKTFRCQDGEDYHARVRRGAEAASGDLLVVLEGGTWPVPGWLLPLEESMVDSRVGVATGMFVESNGRLLGHLTDDQLEAPRHNFVRRLGAVPDDFFVTYRELFLGWTPLTERSRSASFSGHVQSNGLEVLYQPETVVISSDEPRGRLQEPLDG
jgi:hypothetical protein